MRTSVNIHEATLARAAELTGIHDKEALVQLALDSLIAKMSAQRLAELGGTEKQLRPIPRRRSRRTSE